MRPRKAAAASFTQPGSRRFDGAAAAPRCGATSYRKWTLEGFGGTLCVDELHLGRFTLLLATDPLRDRPVAFALVDKNDAEHMRRFLKNLKAHGFAPEVVVTDGSLFYPALLAELWREACHHLCVFHVLKDVNAKVLEAVRRLRRQKARRGSRGRKRRRGRPPKSRARRKGLTNREKAQPCQCATA
ncbi:MAG: transposase [Isosphaeraceae bacterium]